MSTRTGDTFVVEDEEYETVIGSQVTLACLPVLATQIRIFYTSSKHDLFFCKSTHEHLG